MKRNKPKENKFLKWVADLTTEHWLFTSIVITGSSWWFSLIVAFFGESLQLVAKNDTGTRVLTPLGIIITVVIFVLLVINACANKYKKEFPNDAIVELGEVKRKLENKTAGYNLFDKVLSCIAGICKKKYSTQMKTIVNIKNNKDEPPVIYSNPCEQLEVILENLAECLSFLLSANNHKFNKDDIYASIAYNFPEENPDIWKWVDVQDEKGLSLEELQQSGTTFSYLLRNATEQDPFVFFNSKQKAFEQNKYKPDGCDLHDRISGKLLGSIACFRITLKRADKTYIIAVLSISSYNKPFVLTANAENEEDPLVVTARTNINNVIVSEFSERIKIELCNYYIQYLRKKWDSDQQFSLS